MPMYNLIEYSDNYADSSGSLLQFKRDELSQTGVINPNVSVTNSSSFKYKTSILGNPNDTEVLRNEKIVVPLKYLSNFSRSLEMSLINCKIHLELNWSKNCVTSTIAETTFKITNTKFNVPIVTFSTEDNLNLTKELNEGFKGSVYWNEYKSKIETKEVYDQTLSRFPLGASFQGVNRLFVLAFDNTTC